MVWRTNARRWNRLARCYRADESVTPDVELKMQTIILFGGWLGFNSYKGTVTVGLSSEGIHLRLLGPFQIYHPPLLIPYEDIDVSPTTWYLNASSYKYTCAQVAGVEIIIDDDLKGWIDARLHEWVEPQAAIV